MKRTMVMTAILLISVSAALGQTRSSINHTPKKIAEKKSDEKKSAEKQTFAPRILRQSASLIVEGVITAADSGAIRIKTAKGERFNFELDDQTTVLAAGELVSISTMAEIELDASDLHVFDRVEIVAERDGLRRLARIITLISSQRDQVAKR